MLLTLGSVLVCSDLWWEILHHGGRTYTDSTLGLIRFHIVLPLYLVLSALAFASSYGQFLFLWLLIVLPAYLAIIFWLNPIHSNLGPIADIAVAIFAIFALVVTSVIYALLRWAQRRYTERA